MSAGRHDKHPKMDLYGGYLGDGYPMCSEPPANIRDWSCVLFLAFLCVFSKTNSQKPNKSRVCKFAFDSNCLCSGLVDVSLVLCSVFVAISVLLLPAELHQNLDICIGRVLRQNPHTHSEFPKADRPEMTLFSDSLIWAAFYAWVLGHFPRTSWAWYPRAPSRLVAEIKRCLGDVRCDGLEPLAFCGGFSLKATTKKLIPQGLSCFWAFRGCPFRLGDTHSRFIKGLRFGRSTPKFDISRVL